MDLNPAIPSKNWIRIRIPRLRMPRFARWWEIEFDFCLISYSFKKPFFSSEKVKKMKKKHFDVYEALLKGRSSFFLVNFGKFTLALIRNLEIISSDPCHPDPLHCIKVWKIGMVPGTCKIIMNLWICSCKFPKTFYFQASCPCLLRSCWAETSEQRQVKTIQFYSALECVVSFVKTFCRRFKSSVIEREDLKI